MTEKKLDEITTKIVEVIEDGQKILLFGSEDEKFELLDVIASLHNELYREVTGGYYDYMFHWANLGYGGDPDDGLFKEEAEE